MRDQDRKGAEICNFPGSIGLSWDDIDGGDGGIRTLGTGFTSTTV